MATSEDTQYLITHNLAQVMEDLLTAVVPNRHPRPCEIISRTTTLNTPASSSSTPLTALAATINAEAKAALRTLDFDIFQYELQSDELVSTVVEIFYDYNFMDSGEANSFNIPKESFIFWVKLIRANYHEEVVFHNFRHAVNVLQTLHVFLKGFNIAENFCFTDLEVFAMLLAALGHDLQHPGRNNAFLSATLDPLALRYNDLAVLEQHHCATLFAAFDKINILHKLRGDNSYSQNEAYRTLRGHITRCILATEVAKHKDHVAALAEAIDSGFDKTSGEHRQRLMTALIEAADISNEARHFIYSRQWAPLVCEEFCLQGDVERTLGMPVKPMNDRNLVIVAKEQSGFISFLCLGLYQTLAKLIPEMGQCVKNLESNKEAWLATLAASSE